MNGSSGSVSLGAGRGGRRRGAETFETRCRVMTRPPPTAAAVMETDSKSSPPSDARATTAYALSHRMIASFNDAAARFAGGAGDALHRALDESGQASELDALQRRFHEFP